MMSSNNSLRGKNVNDISTEDVELTETERQEPIWLSTDFDPTEYYSIYVTCESLEEARAMGQKLVGARVAACVNIIPRIVSIYEWRDKLMEDNEALMFIKTRGNKVEEVIKIIKKLHSYEVPSIVAFPIKAGYPLYLEWIDEQTRPKNGQKKKKAEN